jgi:hypothetical protein
MSGQELLDKLGNPYEEQYCAVRNLPSWPDPSSPLHVALLLADFDTELCMNGMLGFLENSTGAYLDQTIEALRMVGAEQSATTLNQIREAMHRYGVSHERLRSGFNNTAEFQISSFSQLHPGIDEFSREAGRLAESLPLDDTSQQSVFPLLEAYLEHHSAQFLVELQQTVA